MPYVYSSALNAISTNYAVKPQTLTLILIIITSALQLYYLTVWQGYNFKGALRKGAGSAVGFLLSIMVIWPVGALLSYHLRVSIPFFLLFLFLRTARYDYYLFTLFADIHEKPWMHEWSF